MFYTVFDALTNAFFSELASRHSLGDRNFLSRKIPKSVENHCLDTIAPNFDVSWHTWYLHEELIPLVLFSPMLQQEKKESVRHRFIQFENSEVTTRIGLPPGKPDFKLVPPQNTQVFDLKRTA